MLIFALISSDPLLSLDCLSLCSILEMLFRFISKPFLPAFFMVTAVKVCALYLKPLKTLPAFFKSTATKTG